MVPTTRRALLHSFSGVAAVLAGCSGMFEGSNESTRTVSEDDSLPTSGATTASDPATVSIRVDTDYRPVWLSNDGNRPTPDPHTRRLTSEVIDSESKANRITVAEGVNRSEIDTFLGETDFESETVYLQTVIVKECFQLSLCQISWGAENISTDYGRLSRPYDEFCESDNELYTMWFIRIPEAINDDDISSYSSSAGGSPCNGEGNRKQSVSNGASSTTVASDTQTAAEATKTDGEQA